MERFQRVFIDKIKETLRKRDLMLYLVSSRLHLEAMMYPSRSFFLGVFFIKFISGDFFFLSFFRRRESFLLRAGHKCAHMYTESAEYQYMKMLTTPKAWFKANIDATLKIYGRDHNIQKEDLLLGKWYMPVNSVCLEKAFFKIPK